MREITVGDGAPRFAIWRTPQALIVPRGMPGRANFDAAAAGAEEQGWPVFERDTGGDLTPQTPGIVNLSLVFRMDGDRPSIETAYRRLTGPVIAFLKTEFGIDAETAAVPGAFCDGTYNIAVGGKKLGGTAQRWRLLNVAAEATAKPSAVLAHVALMCTIDLGDAIRALNRFYRDLGLDRHVDPGRHVTLADLVGPDRAEPAAIAATLRRFLVDYRI